MFASNGIHEAAFDLQSTWDTRFDTNSHYYRQGLAIIPPSVFGDIACKERATQPVISPRSAIRVLNALIENKNTPDHDKVRIKATLAVFEVYTIFATRTPTLTGIRKSTDLGREDTYRNAIEHGSNTIFLDQASKYVYFFICEPKYDTPYHHYAGVLRDSENVFDQYWNFDPFYEPFGMLAPLASQIFSAGEIVYREDDNVRCEVFSSDAEAVINTIFDDITFADPATRKLIKRQINQMECSVKYFPPHGGLALLRHQVASDWYFGMGLPDSAILPMAVRNCHKITSKNMRSYIHSTVLLQTPGDPLKFSKLPVCIMRKAAPRDYRVWIAHASNSANAGLFPPVARVVRDFEFLDDHFHIIRQLSISER